MVEIRRLQPSDFDSLVELFHEMDAHWQDDVSPAERIERSKNWRDNYKDMITMVGIDRKSVVAFATLVPMFPGRACGIAWFLKELFVSAEYRDRSLGRTMMQECAKTVLETGGSRLDLTVDASNPKALRFYERLGAVDTHKTTLRWMDDNLEALAS